MHNSINRNANQTGFTLIEMAIVLVIIGLLLAGLIAPLGVQRDLRDYAETRTELAELREALIGFALSHSALSGNPYLPCPAAIGGNGVEQRSGGVCQILVGGEIPWATLGLGQRDSWNNTYLYKVTALYANSNVGFTLTPSGDNNIKSTAGAVTNIASNIPAVIVSKGKNGASASISLDEIENDNNDTNFVSHEQIDVAANTFDDILVWLPDTILVNRMVSAGLLP